MRLFSTRERDGVRRRLLDAAHADPAVVGAAHTGSYAAGTADRWSDIDLGLAVDGPLPPTIARWTDLLYRDFGAVHHWDLPSGSSVYRVFLLTGCLEADVAFTPAADFGPRGPHWRTEFGGTAPPRPPAPPDPGDLAGLAWHHALHARVSIERGRLWQAEHWIGALREKVIALACLRLGHPTSYAKGAHLLPDEVTGPLTETLVGTLDEATLRRALSAATTALDAELARTDPRLAARLRPTLAGIAAPDW